MSTLTEKVRRIALEETPTGHKWAYEHYTSRPGRVLEEPEYMSRAWGFMYGLAYGIARGEDPYEQNESVAAKALEAAEEVFNDNTLHGLNDMRRFESGQVA